MTYHMHSDRQRRHDPVVIFTTPSPIRDRDAINIGSFWSQYQVKECHNATVEGMKKKIEGLKETIDAKCSCLVLVFLTPGEHGIIYDNKGGQIALQSLLAPLMGDQCLNLAGKPKIIILQTDPPTLQADGDSEKVTTIPSQADLIYLWSRVPGKMGMAYPEREGSLFISTLVEMLSDLRGKNLTTIMRRTITRMYDRLQATDEEWLQEHQELPFIISQLRKQLVIPNTE